MPVIKAIIGLGNPGREYQNHRHNVGFWLLEQLLPAAEFRPQTKFSAELAQTSFASHSVFLLKPQTYMNRSGLAVRQLLQFYKIPLEQILVVHDDLDLPPGVAKLKKGGGHGGHNGLRDIIAHLHSKDFYRLRIGIGHPGDRSRVSDYVLSAPSQADRLLLQQAIENSIAVLDTIVAGKMDQAMNRLHSQKTA